MRKTCLIIFLGLLVAMLTAAVGAQSGRRGMKPLPPPTPEQLSELPIVVATEREAVAPAKLSVLPDSLLKRQLKALDNGSFSLADFAGKVIVINLWASWCGPCRREVPEYENVRREFVGREVEFIGLTTEDPRTESNRVRDRKSVV